MKKLDIEAYIDGELSEEALAQFNEELRQNPVFAQQVETQRKLSQHLRTQLLREQVTAALADRSVPRKPQAWALGLGCALLILLAGYFCFWVNKPTDVQPTPAHPSIEWKPETPMPVPTESTPPATPPPTVQEDKMMDNKPRPIAELPLPKYPSPNVRGQNADNTAWKAMLDKLWYTDFPPANTQFGASFTDAADLLAKRDFTAAFVKLEMQERKLAQNDTLRYLKGYCLLELGEGADAVRYFEQLEVKQPGWQPQLQWYRGLGLLLSGDVNKALPIFKTIAKTPGHPLRKQGQKAVGLLERG